LMLFDLAADIGETTNVAAEHTQVAQEMADAMADWEKGLSQPRWRDGAAYEKWDRLRIETHRMKR